MISIKRIIKKIHLWLGLLSGIVIFIVCTTACLWVFNEEIERMILPDMTVQSSGNQLPPSRLKALSEGYYPGMEALNVQYVMGEAARVSLSRDKEHKQIFVNPYTGAFIYAKDSSFDFFKFVITGHRTLWLPREVGRLVVNYSVLIFVITLLSGLVLWWPKTKKTFQNGTRFKWKNTTGGTKRIFDLHNILGFYSCIVLLAIGMTGMVWGLDWWSKGTYWLTTGGKHLPEWSVAQSDTLKADTKVTPDIAVDYAFNKLLREYPEAEGFQFGYAKQDDSASSVYAAVYRCVGKYYNRDVFSFDRYTLREIPQKGPYVGKYADADFGDKLRRMNYDIHVGAILGLPGKVIAFFASLIGATLPITGFLLWWKRIRRKKKRD